MNLINKAHTMYLDCDVFTAMGKRIGTVEKAVVDPRSRETTHLVLYRNDFLPEHKMIPLEYVKRVIDRRHLILRDTLTPEMLPRYDDAYFVSADGRKVYPVGYLHPLYYYPAPQSNDMMDDGNKKVTIQQRLQVVDTANVQVGTVADVFTDSDGQTTHFTLQADASRKLIPVNWIKEVLSGKVFLAIPADVIHRLKDYREDG